MARVLHTGIPGGIPKAATNHKAHMIMITRARSRVRNTRTCFGGEQVGCDNLEQERRRGRRRGGRTGRSEQEGGKEKGMAARDGCQRPRDPSHVKLPLQVTTVTVLSLLFSSPKPRQFLPDTYYTYYTYYYT